MSEIKESVTAKLCSFARAYHSNFDKHKIFDDYLAYDMMGKEEYEEIGQLIANHFEEEQYNPNTNFRSEEITSLLHKYISPIPLSRIAYAEQELKDFMGKHTACQYIICGAGMDTFAFRNENSALRIFELDHPDTQRYKCKKIEKLAWNIPKNVSLVPIDFAKDDMQSALTNAGFDPSLPSFFAILGVTYYLTLPVFEQTIQKISKISNKGSYLVFDFPDETTFQKNGPARARHLADITAKLGEPMKQGFDYDTLKKTLYQHHFTVSTHFHPEKIQHTFFAERGDEQNAFENIHFISAIKGG